MNNLNGLHFIGEPSEPQKTESIESCDSSFVILEDREVNNVQSIYIKSHDKILL